MINSYGKPIDEYNVTAEEWSTIYKNGGWKGEGSGRGRVADEAGAAADNPAPGRAAYRAVAVGGAPGYIVV